MFAKLKKLALDATEQSKIISVIYEKIHSLLVRSRINLEDEKFAQNMYFRATHRYLNLQTPTTFDEKLWWIKFNYHDPLMTLCADKYQVRSYVKECGLEHTLNELLGVYNDPQEIEFSSLPEKCVFKTNHGCGGIFISDHPSTQRIKEIKRGLRKSLDKNYYYESREWPYKNIKPLVICEKFLENSDHSPLVDYRFFCFNGKCKYIFVDIDTLDPNGAHKHSVRRNVFDRDWNYLEVMFSRPNFPVEETVKPKNFEVMREYAEILSKPFPVSRIDFYNIDEKPIFGEITFFHAGGVNNVKPPEFLTIIGDEIVLPKPIVENK